MASEEDDVDYSDTDENPEGSETDSDEAGLDSCDNEDISMEEVEDLLGDEVEQ